MTQKRQKSQSRTSNQRSKYLKYQGILPPQVDEDVTFGIMWIRIGKLKLTRGKGPLDNKVIIQFWGQKQPVLLQTKSNPLNVNQSQTMVEYDIKCPITYFKEYLQDMKKNLRLQVQNVGKVDFDITKFLKPNIDLTSRYVFDHFKGAFQIIGQHNRKIGTIQLQMACNFNPQLTALQLGQQEQSQNMNDHQHQQKKIAEKNPQLFNQFYQDHAGSIKKTTQKKQQYKGLKDDRIPNSLCTQMSAQKFNPALYLKEQPKSNKISEKKVLQPSPRSANIVMTKVSQKQRKLSQVNQIVKDKQLYNFPTIAKVLTYSNLRLTQGYDEVQERSKMQPVQKVDREQIKIQKMEYYQYERSKNQSESSKVSAYKIQQQKQLTPRQKINTQNQKQYQRPNTPIQVISKEDVLSDIKRLNSQSDSNLLDQDKEILSRVVNLDQELKKSQVHSPNKQKNKEIHQDSPIKMKTQKPNPISQKQNDIRPITQSNHPDRYLQKQFKQTPQMNYPVIKQPLMMKKVKPSSLVLNLLIQIQTQSIKFLKKKEKFNLIHRPYGCKERIKLGPKFQTDKITIMCPVSEQLVSKMDKLPFIVQFWGAVTNQFLGFIKIDLSKIKKGFMLQGRLNEIAIKSNLMPIIIQKGEIWIENVNGQRSGECSIYAGIGTSAQIALYLNTERRVDARQQSQGNQQQKKKQVKKNNKSQKSQQKRQNLIQQKLDLSNANVLLTNFLYFIDMNSNRNIQQLAELMRKKEVTNQEFQDFILQINPQQERVKQLVYIFKYYVPFSTGQQKFIKTYTLKTSFDQYKQFQQITIKEFNRINKFIQKRLSQQIKDGMTKASSFNIIQKQKLKQIYIKNLKSNIISQTMSFQQQKQAFESYYLQFFQQFVNVKTIFSQEKLNSFYQPSQKLIMQQVVNDFLQILLKKNISLDYLEICLKETDGQQKLNKKLQRFCNQHLADYKNKMTLWYWMCLCNDDMLENQYKEEKFIYRLRQRQSYIHKISLIKQKIASQQAHQNQRKAFQSINKQKNPIQSKPSPKAMPIQQTINIKQKQQIFKRNQSIESISDSNIHQLLNQKQTSNLIKDLININNQSVQDNQHNNKQQYSNVLIQKENVDVSNSQITQNYQKQKQVKYFEHVFEIKGVQLFLQHPKQGEYVIIYKFPYEQQNIGSKKIRILPNKHRYAINLYGQHRISIQGDIKEYLNEIPLKFQLIKIEDTQRQGVQLQGDLHCDQLFTAQENVSNINDDRRRKNTQNRVVLLFGQDVEKVQGKVKIQVYYQSKQSTNPTIGKQTVYNLFLPKMGFVNFAFQLKLQEDKIKSQFQLQHNEEYYVSMTVDMFHESKTLRPYYSPIVSPLYSHLDEEIMFNTSLKLTLNPTILSYIKENSCHVSLNLIYYSKSKGNYEKKQTTFATLKIPLFSLIQSQGISGNYAFKNKYGMFIALCKTYINYDKYEKKSNLSQSNSHLSMTNTFSQKQNKFNTYWVMVHFKELINFQQNVETTFVKFQTIMNAQKYQTQKIHLSEDPLLIFNDFIMIPLNEEQFFSTKIIPISILFDQNQKFAMDISMRPILRKLSKQNYSVNGGYFLVVDENSQMTKMRVGARVIVFKGNATLQPFINAYVNNINLDVLSQIDLKRDLENYNKLLELFKSELKLSKKSFEQSLRQILVNKNEKLPLQLMSSQLLYKLDLTPIVADNEQEVDSLVRNIDVVIGQRRLMQFVQQNSYRLTNFHSQILVQYSFESLWNERIDKNVQYFNLKKQIDVLTLARKIKVIDSNNNNLDDNQNQQQQRKYKQLRITIQKGSNFHYLYNGIKPNVMIKIPQLSYQSKLKSRSSQPQFNQSLREIVDQQNEMIYRNLIIEVYHVSTGRKGEQQQILIGESKLNVFSSINLSKPIKSVSQQKSFRVIISSTMSSKMKATLQITLKLSYLGQGQMNKIRNLQQGQQLKDASRIQEMIKDINKEMNDKRYMFDSSSDDDQY